MLINAVVAVGLGSGITTASMTAYTVHASGAGPAPAAVIADTAAPASGVDAAAGSRADTNPPQHERTDTVVVAKGDTLWSLAQSHLGSGEFWKRIAELNEGRMMPDGERFAHASSIRPGWLLLIPRSGGPDRPANSATDRVTVAPGDTLWDIAEEEYGAGQRWRAVYAANRDKIEQPDTIRPGQVLDVPRQDRPPSRVSRPTEEPEHRRHLHSELPPEPDADRRPPPELPPDVGSRRTASEPRVSVDRTDLAVAPAQPDTHLAWLLAGGGGLFAASALGLLATRRRASSDAAAPAAPSPRHPPRCSAPHERSDRQGRRRPTGRHSWTQPCDLSRRVAAVGDILPDVAAARLNDERLDLLLNQSMSASPPPPWMGSADGSAWSISRAVAIDESSDTVAPYPALVGVGTDEDGGTWLLDLESLGVLQINGDAARGEELARFLADELAINIWSDHVDIIVSGTGEELTAMQPGRLQYEAAPNRHSTTWPRPAAASPKPPRRRGATCWLVAWTVAVPTPGCPASSSM